MEDVRDTLGGAENEWQGWVNHEKYNQMKEKLAIGKEQVLGHMANYDEERGA